MKKPVVGFLIVLLISVSSCNKSNNPPVEAWYFEGTEYLPNTVSGKSGALIATVLGPRDPNYYVQLNCAFPNNILPTVAGSYRVVQGPPAANQVAFTLSLNSGQNIYKSTGGNGTERVAVSIANGNVTLVGSNITLKSTNPDTTSSTFNLNITQEQ